MTTAPGVLYGAAQKAARRRLDDLQFRDAGAAKSLHLGEPRLWRRDHLREGTEFREQSLRQRLDVAPRQRTE